MKRLTSFLAFLMLIFVASSQIHAAGNQGHGARHDGNSNGVSVHVSSRAGYCVGWEPGGPASRLMIPEWAGVG